MLAAEIKLQDFIKKHILLIGVVGVLVLSAVLRYWLRSFLTGDMHAFLIPWFQALKAGGLKAALDVPNNDYNVAYLCLLMLTTRLPFTEVVCVKIVSVAFDYLTALAMVWAVLQLLPKENKNRRLVAAGTFMGALLLPLPLANSAIWGQCDIIYTFFLLLCLIYVLKEKYTLAFAMLSLSICFKLQGIFFLPLLLVLYCIRRRFSLLPMVQIPLFVFLFGLLGRSAGDSIFFGFEIYLKQAQNYKRLYMDYPNIFAVFAEADYKIFALPAILFTLLVFMCVLFYLLYKNWQIEGDAVVLFLVWSIVTCAIFLPAMHDRYAFAAELFIWLFFLARPTLKRFVLALAVNFVPVLVYVRVFLEVGYITQVQMSLFNLGAYLLLSVCTFLYIKTCNAFMPATLRLRDTVQEEVCNAHYKT